jgi:hypothetical protein
MESQMRKESGSPEGEMIPGFLLIKSLPLGMLCAGAAPCCSTRWSGCSWSESGCRWR